MLLLIGHASFPLLVVCSNSRPISVLHRLPDMTSFIACDLKKSFIFDMIIKIIGYVVYSGCQTDLITGSCIQTFNRLSIRFDNRFDNRLCRVNGALAFCRCLRLHAGGADAR